MNELINGVGGEIQNFKFCLMNHVFPFSSKLVQNWSSQPSEKIFGSWLGLSTPRSNK